MTQGESLDDGLSGLLTGALGQVGLLFRTSLSTGAKLATVVLLCSLAYSARAGEESALQAVNLAGALAITALTMTDMAVMIGLGRDTLGRMGDFSSVLLPAMAVLTAATGGVTAAAVRQGATVLFSQLLITAMDRLLVPLVYAYVAVSCQNTLPELPGQRLLCLFQLLSPDQKESRRPYDRKWEQRKEAPIKKIGKNARHTYA